MRLFKLKSGDKFYRECFGTYEVVGYHHDPANNMERVVCHVTSEDPIEGTVSHGYEGWTEEEILTWDYIDPNGDNVLVYGMGFERSENGKYTVQKMICPETKKRWFEPFQPFPKPENGDTIPKSCGLEWRNKGNYMLNGTERVEDLEEDHFLNCPKAAGKIPRWLRNEV